MRRILYVISALCFATGGLFYTLGKTGNATFWVLVAIYWALLTVKELKP